MRRGTHGAENRGGVQRRRRFLPIVGRALNVVHCSPRRPCAGRRIQACYLRVCLGMHFNVALKSTTPLPLFYLPKYLHWWLIIKLFRSVGDRD